MDLLERIVHAKKDEIARDKEAMPLRRLIEMATGAPPPRDFPAALRRAGQVNVIAEIKRASPSRGKIKEEADVIAIARAYAAAGAAAVSVLTETRFFLGAPEHLTTVKETVEQPVLRKDFVIDEYQLYQSRALGADAVLLIARLLPAKALSTLVGVCRSLHMEALVEVHAAEEIGKAVDAGAAIIGVNNRDLATMTLSIETSLALAGLLPASVAKVSESGIEARSDIDRLLGAGYDAFLVGERLMREPDPGAALRDLIGGAS
jgi:indole-3-glycerol phosphate synthase